METPGEYEIVDERTIGDKQLEIYNHYGFVHQLKKLREECLELALAIEHKDKPFNNDFRNLIEELGDVKNLIQQIELGNPYIHEGVTRFIDYKSNRELDRISKAK